MDSPYTERKPTRTKLRPLHVLPKLRTCWEKSTPRLRTPTSTLKRWCFPGGGEPTLTLRLVKPTRGRNYRLRLTSSQKSFPNQNTPKMRVPSDRTYSGEQHAKAYHPMARPIPNVPSHACSSLASRLQPSTRTPLR